MNETATTPRLHQSIASELLRSPLHGYWKAFRKDEEPYSETTTRGQIAHSLLLGGSRIQIVDADDWRTKAAKETRELARAQGLLPILRPKMEDATALYKATCENLKAHGIELSGKSEVTLQWTNRMGTDCEGTLDHLIRGRKLADIYDLKFCDSAEKRVCEGKFLSYGYDIQHAAYTEAVETLWPEHAGRVKMQFIFQETNPPYAMRLMPLAGSMRESGRWRWARANEIWQDCLEQCGVETPWPAYADDGEPAECPAWALNAQIAEASPIGSEVA